MIHEHITGIGTRSFIIGSFTVPSFHVLHVIHEGLAIIVIIATVMSITVSWIRSLGKTTRRWRSRAMRTVPIFTPNAVFRADAELLHVALGVGVVVLDQVAPGFLDGIVTGVLEFPAPVGKPVADLRIGQTGFVGQLFLFLPVGVGILASSNEPIFEHAFDFRREEALDRPMDVAWWPYFSAKEWFVN